MKEEKEITEIVELIVKVKIQYTEKNKRELAIKEAESLLVNTDSTTIKVISVKEYINAKNLIRR